MCALTCLFKLLENVMSPNVCISVWGELMRVDIIFESNYPLVLGGNSIILPDVSKQIRSMCFYF